MVYGRRYTSTRRSRTYRPYKRSYASSALRTKGVTVARRYVRKYKRTYKRKVTGPKPTRVNQSMKAMRMACKNNEDYMVMFTDSQFLQSTYENTTVIGDYQLLASTDIAALNGKLPVNTGAGLGNNYLIIKSATHQITFSNTGEQALDVFIWIVRARRDPPATTANGQAYRPSLAWQMGVEGTAYGNVAAAPSAQGGYVHPHSQPTDSVLFQQLYYTVKRRRIQLLPGGTKDVSYSATNLPYKASGGLDGLTSAVGGVGGITMACLWQARGVPVIDGGAGGVYYSRPNFAVIENKRYHFTYSADSGKNLSYTTNYLVNPIAPAVRLYTNPMLAINSTDSIPVTVKNTTTNPMPVVGTGLATKATALAVYNSPTTLT